MPTYQYRCTECLHEFEAVQKFTDAALTECPECGKSLRKLYSAVGVVFKGSGFYATDNRKGSGGESKESAKPAETKPSESKPAAAKPAAAAATSASAKTSA